MITQKYPRSPKVLLGGMTHLARFIDCTAIWVHIIELDEDRM